MGDKEVDVLICKALKTTKFVNSTFVFENYHKSKESNLKNSFPFFPSFFFPPLIYPPKKISDYVLGVYHNINSKIPNCSSLNLMVSGQIVFDFYFTLL